MGKAPKKRDPREKKMVDHLAQGNSAHAAALQAGYSPSYAHSHSATKAKDLEELVDQRRAELMESRTALVPVVKQIESKVLRRVNSRLDKDEDLPRVEVELAKATISNVNRAVRIEDDIPSQNLIQVAVQIGQLIREQVNFSGDAVPVAAAGSETDQSPSAT
ncbi:MAG: hypothetical protein KJ621_14165 [Proteobacteria bacterium]|nr:hypothetical protein [Pseudomonadota bacterium]